MIRSMRNLSRRNDAFGLEIRSYLRGGPAFEIAERDDGYVDAAMSTGQYFDGFRRWPNRQKKAIKHARGRHVLDVGCGAGRVSLYLQAHGFLVTAIDASPLAVGVCRERGVSDARVLPIEDIGRLRHGQFDTVVLFGNNFGLLGGLRKGRRLLEKLYRITTDNAVMIAETVNPYLTTNPAHRRYRQWNRRRGRMPGQIRMRIRFQTCATPWFDYLLVSPAEMRTILKGTGWKVNQLVDGDQRCYVAIIDKV
jgi:SAM-dependent methyltransferase